MVCSPFQSTPPICTYIYIYAYIQYMSIQRRKTIKWLLQVVDVEYRGLIAKAGLHQKRSWITLLRKEANDLARYVLIKGVVLTALLNVVWFQAQVSLNQTTCFYGAEERGSRLKHVANQGCHGVQKSLPKRLMCYVDTLAVGLINPGHDNFCA